MRRKQIFQHINLPIRRLLPQRIGLLFVGNHDAAFAKIKLTKELKDLNGKIIECKYENNGWAFMRERIDKSYPNSYNTAMCECIFLLFNVIFNLWCLSNRHFNGNRKSCITYAAVCQSIQYPVTKDILLDTTENLRFVDDSEIMPPPRGFMRH